MLLSVIVIVVDGGATLRRCLAALANQADAPPLEILVPWDDTLPGVPALCVEFPGVRAVAMGHVATMKPPLGIAGQHELIDYRRSAGLAAATGDLVALLEDRGAPVPGWAATMARLHQTLPHPVVGGAVANACEEPLSWAVFLADFSRYQPPLEAGPRTYISDTNVCYKRAAVETMRPIWSKRFHETSMHWALQREGATLFLSPEPLAEQWRPSLSLRQMLKERVVWGRLFAHTRALEHSLPRRLMFAAMTPALPFLLFARVAKQQLKSPSRNVFLRVAPTIWLLLAAWSVGEAIGYITGKP